MSKNKRKKSMNWYDLHHRFSIRKYHFGAASVLLGVALALTGGAEVSATTTDTSASTTPSSVVETTSSAMTDTSVSKTPSSTTEPTTPISDASTATSTSETTSSSAIEEVTTTTTATERVATIEYTVEYQDESGKAVASTVKSVETKTTDKTAIATVTETATVPAGYELVANEMTASTTGVVEGANTKVVFKVVKKVAADTASTTTSSSTTDEPATTPATTSTVAAPTTVAEAKVNLEQNISEAQVLSDEANRLYTASPEGNEALKIVADATKLAATKATAVFENSVATLEEVNAQISAVRTNVDALVLELRKYYPDGEITAVLNTAAGTPAATTIDVTNPASASYAQHGVWEIPDPVKAANSGLTTAEMKATITEVEKKYPAGYIGDQDANRDTFLVFTLDTIDGYGNGEGFNDWVKHNYYLTFSVSTDAAERKAKDVIYAKLVEKTINGDKVIRTVELQPNVESKIDELTVLENDSTHKTVYKFTYLKSEQGTTVRQLSIENSNGKNMNVPLYNKLDQSKVGMETNSYVTLVPGSTSQTTSYYVKENKETGRLRELLARYTQDKGLIGDKFQIGGIVDFDNYELIESELPDVESGILQSDYVVGTQWAVIRGAWNEARLYTITADDGTEQIQLYMLDPNNPDWAKFYKSNNVTIDDLAEYFRLMFTSENIKPGEVNTKSGTFSAKFYEADKLVLESTQVQVLDANGDVIGTLNDAKTAYTTPSGETVAVKSVTNTMVTDEDGTIHTINNLKVYKTNADGDYVDANGAVLKPLQWRNDVPGVYKNDPKSKYYGKATFESDGVEVSTGAFSRTVIDPVTGQKVTETFDNGNWMFGVNYKTDPSETRLDDAGQNKGKDTRWDLGGLEMSVANGNAKNEQHARYWYTEKGGVDVYYITSDGKVLTDFTTSDGKTVADKVTIVGHGATDSAYNTASARYSTITAADGTVYYYKQIDTTAKNLHPVVDDKTDTDYRSNEKIDAEKGTIKSDTVKQLTYVYEKAGNVNVHYVDTDGNELQPSVEDVTNGKPGTGYDTVLDNKQKEITVNGTVYYLVPAGEYKVGTVGDENNLTVVGNGKATGIDATTGTVDAGVTKNVTYVYQKGGDVIVNYVDQDGNPISGTTDKGTTTESTVTDTSYTKAGTAYNTTDLKPTTITTTDGKVYQLVPEATKGNEDGKVESGVTKEVTYVYKEVKGSVVVNYISITGEEIQAKVVDTPESSTGTEYDTTDVKPETITTKDGRTFKLVPQLTQGTEKGEVVPGVTKVTYVYEEVKGDVVVNYVNTDGKVIATQVVDTKTTSTGTAYDTTDNKPEKIVEDATGDVYYYKEVQAGSNETGKVVEGTTEVTYVYEKAGNVVVNYTLADGTVIKDRVNDETNAKPGSPYDTKDNKPETITTTDGKVYKLVPNATKGNETGDVEAGKTTEVTYIYEEVKSDVVVEYYNTAGEVIAKTVVDEEDKSVGTVYNTDEDNRPETITATDDTVYYYKEVKDTSAPTVGKVAETITTVQYVYEKAGDVIVHYIATDGTPISGVTNAGTVTASTVDDTVNGKPGSTYDTSDLRPTTITTDEGKTYELVPAATKGNENGTVESGVTKEVTYVYKEVKGSVVVNYISTTGEELQAQVVDTPEASTGTEYDTTDVKPETITTKDGRTFKLVPKLTQGSEKGEVVPGVTKVTYVYEEVKGDVVVNYVNTDGEVIASQVVDTKTTSTGTAYDTTDNKPEKIVEDATGDVYYYKEVQAGSNEKGKVVEGTTEVTYVYEKAGNVVVNYITEDGTVIKDRVNDETNAKPGSPYDTTDNKPTEIVTEDGSRYVLIPSKTIGTENGTVEGGKTTEITYVYKKVANWVPEIPGVPENERPVIPYPFDPNTPDVPVTPTPDTVIPNVPGYTPVDPKDNTPLTPVDPEDPNKGYVPPTPTNIGEDTPIPYVQNGNVVVNYVTEDGTVIKAPVQDETNVPAGKSYDTTDNKPTEIITEDGSRYVLIPSKTIGTENGTVEGGKTTEITYVYKKVANWVPEIPGVPENERPVIPYPFDPNTPDIPVTPTPDTVIPNVPGYTPVDPKDNTPLTPVDPEDPNKGYVPPTPTNIGEDTPIPYVQNGNVVVNYVTEDGTVIKAPVQDETNVPAGKSYDTTDNKPKTITTEDGTTYELVRVDGSENGTVEGGKTTEVTYVYRKVTPAKKVVTNHVDEDGNPIAPQEEGTTPNKSISGYEFTGKTVTDPDGNTTHIYRKVKKVVTNHVDEDGNPIAPQEEGTTPNKSIPGYEFTGKTVTDPDGNTTHIYRKVKKVVTNHVDEDGNPIAPQEEGTTPNKSIPGYEFTGKTITDKDGNTTHIYRKINNSVKPTPPTTNTPSTPKPNAPMKASGVAQLPNTGESSSSVVTALGAGMLLASLGLVGKRRKDSEE
ncbi:TPA: MucBP domain-containing protein [Streptococcus suis]